MRDPRFLAVGVLFGVLIGCGGTPISPTKRSTRESAFDSRSSKVISAAEFPAVQPSRPIRAIRPPNGLPTIWPKDVRVNTLISNHGIGTAGEPGIAILPDEVNGTFVFWEDAALGLVRAQRLTADGTALWTGGGITNSAAYQGSPSAVNDGRGGALVAWFDGRNGNCDSVTEMSCALFIQRVDGNGAMKWGEFALPVTSRAGTRRFAIISDGANGAYLAWNSYRGYAYADCCSYYMQHIDADGQPLWVEDGIRVSELPTVASGAGVTKPRLISDGAGGAILAWWNTQSTERPAWLMAQRVDRNGNFLWGSEGVQVSFTGSGHPNFDVTPDGSGGAIIAVQSNDAQDSQHSHVYLQRLGTDGTVMWGSTGVQVSSQVGAQIAPTVVSDGRGGSYVAWTLYDLVQTKNDRISVAHVDAAGNLTWPSEITATATALGQTNPRLVSDQAGGVIVAWQDCRNVSGTECAAAYNLYAQRIGPTGVRFWAPDGFPVSSAVGNQGVDYGNESRPGFEMISVGDSLMFAWPDGRLKQCSASIPQWCDLYAQRLTP